MKTPALNDMVCVPRAALVYVLKAAEEVRANQISDLCVIRNALSPQILNTLTNSQIIEIAKRYGYEDLPTVRLAYQGFHLFQFARAIAEQGRVK